MTVKRSASTEKHWESVRTTIAGATIFAQSKAVSVGIAGTTLQSSIAEALNELDTARIDPVTSLGEGDTTIALSAEMGDLPPRRKGKIQRIEDAIQLFYGDGENPGLFEQLRELPDIEVG